jgi:hypothetical protein
MSYLKGFKKAGTTDTHTIMRHPNGHEIHIAHKGLDAKMQKQLSSLPIRKYAEGTPDAPVAPEPPMAPMAAPDDRAPASQDMPGQILQSQPGQNVLSTLQAQGGQDGNVTPTSPDVNLKQSLDPQGLNALAGDVKKYQTMGDKALQGIGAAQGQSLKDQSAINQNAAYRATDAAKKTQESYDALNQERMALQQAVQDGQITPDHYINSKSAGGKIALGIGLFISGAGQSMHNTAFNPALEMLQKNIDNDIRAQEANLGAKKSLLEANLKQFGNLRDATEMARVQMRDATAYRIEAAAQKSGSPLAIQQAQLARAKWGTEGAQTIQGIAQRQAVQKMLAQPLGGAQGQQGGQQQGSHQAVAQRLEAMKVNGLIDDKQYSAALGELHDLQNHESQTNTLLSDYDNMVKQQWRPGSDPMHGRFLSPFTTTPAQTAFRTHIMAPLRDAEGRINDEGMKRVGALEPGMFSADDRVKMNRGALQSFMQEKAPKTDTLSSLGLVPAAKTPIREMKPNVKGKGK